MKKDQFTVPTLKIQINIGFIASWFVTSLTTLILAVVLIFYLYSPKTINPTITGSSFKLYTALPDNESYVSQEIVYSDARAKIVEDFLKGYKSPLADMSQTFVQVADKYKLDYRLLPAISMQESNGAKRMIKNSYNPFGYGIYGSLVIKFQSWEEAIERVGRALREDYLNQGLKTPYQIMAKYTPPSLAKGGAWAKGVSSFMEELQ